MKKLTHKLAITLLASLAIGCTASKQVDKEPEIIAKKMIVSDELFLEIQHMDSVMFDAFNAHDIEKLKVTFTEDLEFYHDKGGFADYQLTMKNFVTLFENNKTTGLRRDLVKGTLEVYPIKDYGAIEVCQHRFCHVENGKDDCGVFKNVMVWKKINGQWKVSRVISFDH